MMRRQSISEQEVVNFIIQKSKESEATNPYDAKAWLLTGKSVVSKNFSLQYEAYLLEKRLKNVEGSAYNFEHLFRRFGNHVREDISEIADSVRICTLSKGKETPEQQFLYDVFTSFSKEVQMEVLIQCSEFTPVLFEKCQCMLLLVKLFPDTINQKNGGELLFTLLSCESDAYSTFRKLLVVELVPSVLQLTQNLAASPRFITLLNQCIEYYVLVAGSEKEDINDDARWGKLYQIVDQIGSVLQWNICPFFRGTQNSGASGVESLYQALQLGFQHRNHYSVTELAYITVVVFLRCIVAYYELLRSCSSAKFGEKSKLILVEVFTPRPHRNTRLDPKLPVLTTVSNCSSVGGNQGQVHQHFIVAVKVWEIIMAVKGDPLEKEFFEILYSMKSIDLQHWDVFKEFSLDYHTYIGQHYPQDSMHIQSSLKLASMYCSFNNFKLAAEYAIKGVTEAVQHEATITNTTAANPDKPLLSSYSSFGGSKEDFSFYNPHVYNTDSQGNFIYQRRVHFLSENRWEIIAYAANILIRCFYESLDVAATSKDDRCVGHLMTLLQLEWPSPPAELIFTHILETIRRNGRFRYFPFFGDFVIEPDFLEQFMAISTHESKTVQLELFPVTAAAASSGRRIGTRGVEKGSKTEFKTSMLRQMMKNGRENLEALITKFLTLNKADILTCFDY